MVWVAACGGEGVRSVRAGVFGTAALSLCLVISAVSVGYAQSPPSAPPAGGAAPLPGFVPPYEITKIVRAAGYDPLTRPRREGTTYVVRATNYRGILMRIVIDARSGAIRAVNRIVPGPGPYGVIGVMGPPPYGGPYDPPIGPLRGPPPSYPAGPYGPLTGPPPPYPPPYYDGPPGYGMSPDMLEPMEPPGGPMEADLNTPPPPPVTRSHPYPAAPSGPPLPRSRPSESATHEAKPPRTEKPLETPAIKSAPAPGAASETPAAPPVGPATPAPVAAPPVPPSPPAAAAPAKKAPPALPPIQD